METELRNQTVVDLDALALTEILDHDPRPTFVLDLHLDKPTSGKPRGLQSVFCNSALRSHERLIDALIGYEAEGLVPSSEKSSFDEFKEWATGVIPHDDSKDGCPLSFTYGGYFWIGLTIRDRWRLVNGTLLSATARDGTLADGPPKEVATGGLWTDLGAERTLTHQAAPETTFTPLDRPSSSQEAIPVSESFKDWNPLRDRTNGTQENLGAASPRATKSSGTLRLDSPEQACPDWTVAHPKGVLTAHLKHARNVDWASTPLGAMSTWTPEFRQMANMVMSNPHPAALFWGSDLTMLYNEAYVREVAGNKHPALMGTGFSGPFSELWDMVAEIFQECARTGVSIRRDNDYLPMERQGFLEETFFTWSFTPIYGGTDKILGFYNAPFDMSQEERYRRSMNTVNHLGHQTAQAKTVKEFWGLVLKGLEQANFDITFALLYSVGESDDQDRSSVSSGSTVPLNKSCHFEGALGIPEGHPAIPQSLDLRRSREGFTPSFREAVRTSEPLYLTTRDGTLPEALLEGIEFRGFGDPSNEAIIFPLRPTSEDNVVAFLLVGLNPRRPYDVGYKSFATMLNRQLANSLASVILFEEEVRRNKDAAEAAHLAQEKLSQQLAIQSDRLRRMTELSPLGMFLISPDGELTEANECFFEMTGLPRRSLGKSDWMKCIINDSRTEMDNGWRQLTVQHTPWSGELQFATQETRSINVDGRPINYWVLFTAQPEFGSGGTLRSIMGSITDISQLKWAQGVQDQRIEESEERRRQQNEFIDITSHEMRNPLSAILQCADDIQSTLQNSQSTKTALTPEMVESCLDSASTITLCTQHQKAIVDDILTVSKLASNLLVVNPVPTQPVAIIERALKMFEPEMRSKGILLQLHEDATLHQHQVDWILIDQSRVLQVLINLITNAIKFTANAVRREVTVRISASANPPKFINGPGFEYIPAKAQDSNADRTDVGQEEHLYLQFDVTDTGCGLTPEEKNVLFKRFSQASPRTHAQYGGSGLGLFISKQLAELHGGRIGVATESGVGSTFAFYVAARRTEPLKEEVVSDAERILSNIAGNCASVQQELAPQRQVIASSDPSTGFIDSLAVAKPQKSLHILVVEDNQINQKILVKQLRLSGSKVSVANDGFEALTFLDGTSFRKKGADELDIVLMDLEMPNMDGLTCVREIRKLEADKDIIGHVPVIAVTANVRDEQISQAMDAGMDGVVSKPFRIPDLYRQIEVVLLR